MVKAQLHTLYDHIKTNGNKSTRALAKIFKTSPSSIFRKLKKIKSRTHICGASFFETVEGQKWLSKLIVAVILIFGVLCGIGGERLSLFFSLLSLTDFIGLSERSINRMTQKVESLIHQYGLKYDDEVKSAVKDKKVILGVDETFFNNLMILVGMDLKSGFIFCEDTAENRTHDTWKKKTKSWFSCFDHVTGMVSDRAKALIKLASDTLKKPSYPDLFHALYEISKTMGKDIGQKLKMVEVSVCDAQEKGQNKLAKHFELQRNSLEDRQIKYQSHLQAFSIALHPFTVDGSKQEAKAAAQQLDANLESIKSIGDSLNIKSTHQCITKVSKQTADMAKQIDVWWQNVESSLDGSSISHEQKLWLMYYYLPCIYWQKQITKTKSKAIREAYEKAYQSCLAKIERHSVTKVMMETSSAKVWLNWATDLSDLFQRTSSAIEGRNGWLSQMHFCGRGITVKRLKSQSIMHNYFLKRSDDTTACERIVGIKPTCLFEYIVKNIGELPQPRKRSKTQGSNMW